LVKIPIIAEVIAAWAPDIVCLQKTDVNRASTLNVDEARPLRMSCEPKIPPSKGALM
jgi:hypothetical protein